MTAALRIVLATQNAGKVRELAEPLAHTGVKVLGLDAFPEIGEIDEYGLTFEENARIKATTVVRHTGLVSVADDSGLEVDALDGAPGVHSARYADDWPLLPDESRDARNMRKLLHALAAVPEARRACRYVCCMTAVTPDDRSLTTRGIWEGRLLAEQRGSNGFGYDPLFFDPTLGLTAAQMRPEQKNARSHRGKALRALLDGWAALVRA